MNQKTPIQNPLSESDLIHERIKCLQAEINRLNNSLEQKAAELHTLNREFESFSHSVSHDLRAPLRGIEGLSRILLENYANRLDEQGKGYLRHICNAVDHMKQLIEDLLSLSRITQAEMRRSEVNLSELARAIADELKKTQPERNVAFCITDGIIVHGDARLLRTMLDNLLQNAWKFTSGHFSAKIDFGTQQTDDRKVYFVRDDGVGFDMQYATNLFAPFQRFHSSSEFAGSGIGLSIVQRIIHRHGGKIWAEAGVEKGATFYFTLSYNSNNSAAKLQPE